jgi:phosphoglycerate dehydrogenase-like enzyme
MVGLFDEEIVRRLQADFADVPVLTGPPGAVDVTTDALLAWEANVPDIVGAIRAHRALRWVHDNAAGIPPVLLEALADRETLLTNGSGAQSSAIAEYVVAMLLTFTKRLRELGRFQEQAAWVTGFHPVELRGLTVGIIGLGNAGRAIARLLRPFGVRLLGMRRHPEPVAEVDALYPREEMPRFLAQLDALVIAAPLTGETRGMIGAAQLGQLRSGAYLVNVGRGAIVDEDALIAALRAGHLAGAALDVFTVEPLPRTSPLWALPQVIVSPHYCDQTPQTDERGRDLFFDNLRRYIQGEPLRNVVDRQLGY